MEVMGDESDMFRIRPTSCKNEAESEQFIGYNTYAEVPNKHDSAYGTVIPCPEPNEPETRFTMESSKENGVVLIEEVNQFQD